MHEERVAPRRPAGNQVSDRPEQDAAQPKAQAETERGRQGAVEDGDRTRGAAQEDRFGERAMNGRHEAGNGLVHQINAPPPKLKKERKKLDAAKAMLRPKTI